MSSLNYVLPVWKGHFNMLATSPTYMGSYGYVVYRLCLLDWPMFTLNLVNKTLSQSLMDFMTVNVLMWYVHTLTSVQYTIDNIWRRCSLTLIRYIHVIILLQITIPHCHFHPLKCVQWVVLLGGALGRMSLQFLLVFYMPDRSENVRS